MRRLLPVILAAILLAPAPGLSAGPVLAPSARLFVIKTEHFDIIFPERSRPSALRLSGFAEAAFEEVSAKLGARPRGRIPVVITPDIGVFNGLTQLFPYARIILYDTSMDLDWTAFKDNFRGLFVHELTHAVSLQIKAPWADFLSGIFGSWVAPVLTNAPEFMVEGSAVSFESADGQGGRAKDPLVKERLRQDIWENRFKSPMEASGLYDEYPYGSVFYEYGGLFCDYLQGSYGAEKFAELWKNMGSLYFPRSLEPYEVGFYEAFRRTYGIGFQKAWADFRNSLAPVGLLDPPETLAPGALAWMPGGMAGGPGALYWVEARSGRAMRTGLGERKSSVLFDANPGDSISDVSADGASLLLRRSRSLPDGREASETVAYDAARRRFDEAGAVADLRDARFFRGGWVGIASHLHDSDLVYVSGGERRTLLRGSASLMFSSPAVLDSSRIALIAAVGGRRGIGIYDFDSGVLRMVRPGAGQEGLLDSARQLSAGRAAEGAPRRLYFACAPGEGMYRLGVLEGDSLKIGTVEYSGGVHWPVEAGGRIYYLANFSQGNSICAYPAGLGWLELPFSLEELDAETLGAEVEASIAAAGESAAILPYRPLDYANPFAMWLLYPDAARLDRSFRLLSRFYFQDPIESNSLVLGLGYDAKYPFAEASLSWIGLDLPVALSASAGDALVYGASGPPERQSSASLSASLRLPQYPSLGALSFGLGAQALARGRGAQGSPYAWGYQGWNAIASAVLGWEGMLRGTAESSSRGISLTSYQDLGLVSTAYKSEAHFAAALELPRLRLDLWGAWASEPILGLDSTSPIFASDRRPAYFEYADGGLGAGSLLAEGALSWRLADLPIHSSLLGLYFNRAFADLGCRGAWFRAEPLYSAYARVSVDLGAAYGMAAASLRAYAESFARFSEADPARAYGWRIGVSIDDDAMGR